MAKCEGVNKSFERNPPSLNLEIIKEWNDQGYEIEHYGRNIDVLIFGEAHLYQELQRKQLQLIDIIKPEYVLHESLGGWIYEPLHEIYTKQEDRKFNDFDKLKPSTFSLIEIEFLLLAKKIDFKIIGCDLTDMECKEMAKILCKVFPEKYDYDQANGQIKYRKTPYSSFLPLYSLKEDENIIRYREKHMVKTIATYQKKSGKPIIVILGQTHGENIHQGELLQRKEFDYVYINQVNRRVGR